MTDDEFTIKEPKDPFMEALEKLKELSAEQSRERMGVSRAFCEITTLGSCAELMTEARGMMEDAFSMDLPGIPMKEQVELHDRFEALWKLRKEQVYRSIDYAKNAYIVTKKEVSE